jgi:hypothetical protein
MIITDQTTKIIDDPDVTNLDCSYCKSLEVINCPNLKYLVCIGCLKLKTINCPILRYLVCIQCYGITVIRFRLLRDLDARHCPNLVTIDCPNLETLDCYHCDRLRFINCSKLIDLSCRKCPIFNVNNIYSIKDYREYMKCRNEYIGILKLLESKKGHIDPDIIGMVHEYLGTDFERFKPKNINVTRSPFRSQIGL